MFNSQTRNRVLWIMVLGGLSLSLYYLLVYRPLSRTVRALDEPLATMWQHLLLTNAETKSIEMLDLDEVAKGLQQVRDWQTSLEKTRKIIESRAEMDLLQEDRFQQPFQLLDFQNERQLRIDELDRLAKERQVKVELAAQEGLPRYPTDPQLPSLVWAQLGISHHILSSAIACKVSSVKNLSMLPMESYRNSTNRESTLQEIPFRVELIGPMTSVWNFLSSLPLRADEIKSLGLPESLPTKPALFLSKVMMRKNSTEKPDEIYLDAVISGFSFRKIPITNSVDWFGSLK